MSLRRRRARSPEKISLSPTDLILRGTVGVGVWVGRLAIAAALIVGACAQNTPTDPFASYDPNDPFSDPFFSEGFQSDSLDEMANGPDSSDEWLATPEGKAATAFDVTSLSRWGETGHS